jgi:putative ABC transport system permease protein
VAQVIQNVNSNGEVQAWTNVPYPLAKVIRTSYGSDFKKIIMNVGIKQDHILTYNDKKLKQKGGFFQPGVLDMVTLKMLSGSGNSFEDPSSIVLSASAAKVYFGDEDPPNKLIKVDNTLE